MLQVKVKGLKQLQKALKAESEIQHKSLQTAIKIEGFRLRKELQKDIRTGAPGGRKFDRIRFITMWGGKANRRRKSGPLGRLGGRWIKYKIAQKPFSMSIGWVGSTPPKIKRLAKKHQEGFTVPVTNTLRRKLKLRGVERLAAEEGMSRSVGVAKFFFLKKGTTQFKIPSRPILDPFMRYHKAEALRNIKRNFRHKLAGRRI